MFRRSKLFKRIIFVAVIAISSFLLFFLIGWIKNQVSIGQVGQEDSVLVIADSTAIDYTILNSVLQEVPEYYATFFDQTMSSRMSELLDYVKVNEKTMTQETVEVYAQDIGEIVKAYSSEDVPQVYIKVSSEDLMKREYSPASIAIVDSKGDTGENIVDLSAEIKIRGNSTAEVAKKSYTIKFSSKQDVLGMGEAKKWVLNANAFDKSLMRNKLVFDFASTIGLQYTPASAYADVWLNGKFVGNYLLSELLEASSSRVDINTDQGDFLFEREFERFSVGTTYFTTPIFRDRYGVNEPEAITKEQLVVLTSFIANIEMAMQAGDWELFTGYVDEKAYIDYYILSELFKVVDFDYSSTRFYIKNGKLYAGPPWDYDLSSGNADEDFYYDYNYHEGFEPDSSYLGLWCRSNFYSYRYNFPEFTEAVRARYQELQEVITNLYEDNSLGTNQIDLLLEKYGKSFDRNYTTAGWTLTQDFMLERIPETTYELNVAYLRGWLVKRNEFLLNSFE